jgi:hypothetical protein
MVTSRPWPFPRSSTRPTRDYTRDAAIGAPRSGQVGSLDTFSRRKGGRPFGRPAPPRSAPGPGVEWARHGRGRTPAARNKWVRTRNKWVRGTNGSGTFARNKWVRGTNGSGTFVFGSWPFRGPLTLSDAHARPVETAPRPALPASNGTEDQIRGRRPDNGSGAFNKSSRPPYAFDRLKRSWSLRNY